MALRSKNSDPSRGLFPDFKAPSPWKKWRKLLMIAASLGFLTATAGLAIEPRLAKVAAPLVCREHFEISSDSFSTASHESGVNRHFYCSDAEGSKRSITLRIALACFCLFSIGYGILLAILSPWILPRLKSL